MKTKRREFIKTAATMTGGVIVGIKNVRSESSLASIPDLVKIDHPFNGAILNHRLGQEVENGLKIEVRGEAPLHSVVKVNGLIAKRSGTEFIAEIVLQEEETDIVATAEGWFGHNSHRIRVVWDKNSFPRYCFEFDDVIFSFRDIARKKYNSIFDCFFLKGLRDLHRKYNTKFVLEIYYTDGLEYTNEAEFTLSQFPDRYKGEWLNNSDWLKLSFHAYSNMPNWPYEHASAKKLIDDLDKVVEQIYRFGGEEVYLPPTCIHWGTVQPSAYQPLADRGVRNLRAGFRPVTNGWVQNYNMDIVRSEHIATKGPIRDFESNINFMKSAICSNLVPLAQTIPTLEEVRQNPGRAEVLYLMTHEQYFWPFYSNYLPDHFERLDTAIRWATDHGYKPMFFQKGLLGVNG